MDSRYNRKQLRICEQGRIVKILVGEIVNFCHQHQLVGGKIYNM
jgi:hypothetical protein